MKPKKVWKIVLTNLLIILANIFIFSNAFLGFSLLTGAAITMSIAWFTAIGSVAAFTYFNKKLLESPQTTVLTTEKMNSLDDCVSVFEEAIHNGDVFDSDILKNLNQLKRFKRKRNTIKEILLQKFSYGELTYQKFLKVLDDIEEIMYLNMKSILNKISAFDVEEYEYLQKKGFPSYEVSEEKMNIYKEYIHFVKNATKTNEDILLKMDKMLFEISKYNSLEDGEIQNLPAVQEMDQLIKNAKLYK